MKRMQFGCGWRPCRRGVGLALVIFGLAMVGETGSTAQGADEIKLTPRHVSVSGTAIGRVEPDQVVWRINVRRTNKELAKAQSECDATVKKLLGLREDLRLKPEDVQTGYLSIQKIFDRDSAGNQTSFRHFQVDRQLTIRQKDTSRFDAVLAQLIAAEDVEVSYSLESSQYLEIRTKTRLDAVKAARKKANEMSELLGAKLGRVLRIAEPNDQLGMPLGISNSISFSGGRAAEPDTPAGTFAPGAIEVRVTVDVVFEIE